MSWIKPVFDRSAYDVAYAQQMISQWTLQVIRGETPTITDLKGCLNPKDLNRIEGNVRELADKLIKLGYWNSVITNTNWNYSDLITNKDISRLIKNVRALYNAILRDVKVNFPTSILGYEEANAIEKLIYDLKDYIDITIASYRKCGVLYRQGTVGYSINTNFQITSDVVCTTYPFNKCNSSVTGVKPRVSTLGNSHSNAISFVTSAIGNAYSFPKCGITKCRA